MKKIIILIILIFSLSGCYDYNEINDLAIIVGIGIGYEDDKYNITFEILSDNKDKESANISSYTISGSDEIFARAVDNAADRVFKKPYYSHADLVIISKDIAEEHFEEITDYLLRSNYIRDNFSVVIADNPKKILSEKQDHLPVISSSINDAIESDSFSGAYSLKKEFVDIMGEILTYGCDTSIPYIDIKNSKVYLNGIALFQEYKMVKILDQNQSSILNTIKNESNKTILSKTYDNKEFSIGIFATDISLDISSNKLKIEGTVDAKILNNEPNFAIKEQDTLKDIEKDFENILNKKITTLIKELQSNDTDILYLTRLYYSKTRTKDENVWKNVDIESNVKINIAKKGIIYEVQKDE